MMTITLDNTGILQDAAFWVAIKEETTVENYNSTSTLSSLLSVWSSEMIQSSSLALPSSCTNLCHGPWTYGMVNWRVCCGEHGKHGPFHRNPTNVVICEGFHVNNAAFTAYTILPFIACSFAWYAALAFQFHNVKNIPRTFAVRCRLNPVKPSAILSAQFSVASSFWYVSLSSSCWASFILTFGKSCCHSPLQNSFSIYVGIIIDSLTDNSIARNRPSNYQKRTEYLLK